MSFPHEASFLYDRKGDVLHIKTHNITNHEQRTILIGFWLTLSEADRKDHIAELQHYLEHGSRPPGASVQMAMAVIEAREGDRGN